MNDKKRTGRSLAIPLLLLWLTALPADAAQLKYIRVGEYESLTRIVFEFDGTVKFTGPDIRGPGQLSLDFLDTTTDNPALQKMRDRSGRIDRIEFVQKKTLLSTHVGLTSPSFNLKTFYLFTPDRVVMDVYWTGAATASVSKPLPAAEPVTETHSAPPVPESAAPPPAETAVGKPTEAAVPAKEAGNTVPPAASGTDPLQSYLFKALIGFSLLAILILLLVTVILRRKRGQKRPSAGRVLPGAAARDREDRLGGDTISRLDSEIRDELNRYGR